MRASSRKAGLFLLTFVTIAGLMSSAAFAASQTFTGTVGDAMCGAKHVMPGNDASCTRGCTSKGSKYALLVGDKAYLLDVTDQGLLATLDKRAGEKVIVTGTKKDNTIAVTSIRTVR